MVKITYDKCVKYIPSNTFKNLEKNLLYLFDCRPNVSGFYSRILIVLKFNLRQKLKLKFKLIHPSK